jgi:hypothetical protein
VALPRWTLKRLVLRLWEKFQIKCCRNTVRQALKWLGFSLEARKLLNKANPKKAFGLSRSHQSLMKAALDQDHLLVFIDEAHIHLDTDEGGWSIKGERFGLVLVLLDSKSLVLWALFVQPGRCASGPMAVEMGTTP